MTIKLSRFHGQCETMFYVYFVMFFYKFSTTSILPYCLMRNVFILYRAPTLVPFRPPPPTFPRDMFKLFHDEARTARKQVVGIRLKCFLVYSSITSPQHNLVTYLKYSETQQPDSILENTPPPLPFPALHPRH